MRRIIQDVLRHPHLSLDHHLVLAARLPVVMLFHSQSKAAKLISVHNKKNLSLVIKQLSPYLYGEVSPVWAAVQVDQQEGQQETYLITFCNKNISALFVYLTVLPLMDT